jgi:UDP-N-acetylmuramyl pentapeptide phosphotransferase/UDP-N-acetylglucosamine-1-phosphate transferase
MEKINMTDKDIKKYTGTCVSSYWLSVLIVMAFIFLVDNLTDVKMSPNPVVVACFMALAQILTAIIIDVRIQIRQKEELK